MRIGRLDLLKYGQFDACALEFPAAPVDFHLVLGANEAGKSTTLAAVTDLLFGFPEGTTPFNFRFDSDLLRVGGVLQNGNEMVELRRRKGRGDTLEDSEGRKLSNAVLARHLHGLTRDTFRRSFGLNHQRLRCGGHTMLKTEGDIGQALFAAGSGLLGMQALLNEIEKECDAIWGVRHARSRSYYKAKDELDEALKRKTAAEVRPKQWNEARNALAALETEQAALDGERARLERRRNHAQRILRLADPVHRRAVLHEEIRAVPPSPFDAATEEAFAAALELLRQSTGAAQTAKAEAELLRRRLEDRPPDLAPLAHEADIKALTFQAGAALKSASDLPGVEQELQMDCAAAARLAGELGWDASSLAVMRTALPTRLLSARLATLLESHASIQQRHIKALAEHREAAALVAKTGAKLEAQPDTAADGALKLALGLGERATPRHDGLIERQRLRNKAWAARNAAFSRLAPWTGDVAALAGVSAPSEAELEQAAFTLDRAQQDEATASRDRDTASEHVVRLQLEAHQLADAGGAVPWSELVRLRRERDAQWDEIDAHLRGVRPLPEPEESASRFRQTLAETDALADRRFERAEASARLTALGHEQSRYELERQQAETRRAAAERAGVTARESWTARLAAAGLPPMNPAQTRQWQADRVHALEAAVAADEADALLGDDQLAVDAACAALWQALGPVKNAAPSATLPTLMESAKERERQIAEAAKARTRLETEWRGAQQALEDAVREQADAASAAAEWQDRWTEAVAGSSFQDVAVAEAGPRLALVSELRTILARAADLQGRVEGMQADLGRFANQARLLAQSCQLDPTSAKLEPQQLAHELAERLESARSTAQARQELSSRWAEQDHAREAADRQTAAARLQLQPLVLATGSEDLVALSGALERFARRRTAEDRIIKADADILAAAPGHSLDELINQVTGADLEAVRDEGERLSHRIEELTTRMVAQAQRIGEARTGLAGLHHGAEAAQAEADAELARAAIATEADAYVLRRTQAILLGWAIDRYRDRRQSPMLARAGQLFRTLTHGRYTELRIGLDGDTPRLIALREHDDRAVGITAMSDGTMDQLFLSLRLAALEHSLEAGMTVPFLADDLFVNFDDRRAEAGFRVLGEIARKTQVLFFTHHGHLRELADRALHPHVVAACELA